MRGPVVAGGGANPAAPVLQRCGCGKPSRGEGECDECKRKKGAAVQRKAHAGRSAGALDPGAIQARLGAGRSLDAAVRGPMEGAFGRDFSQVRLHTDTTGAALAREVGARAFTVGRHVAFGAGEYRPGTPLGDGLIAHELAHVVQQEGGQATPAAMSLEGESALEKDADRSAMGVVGQLWGATQSWWGETALPRLRSGLALQGCWLFPKEKEEEAEAKTQEPAPTDTGADSGVRPNEDLQRPDPGITQAEPPPGSLATCGKDDKPDQVIKSHTVDKKEVKEPGESVTFTVDFACKPRGDARSKFVGPGGEFDDPELSYLPTTGKTSVTHTWNGKKQMELGAAKYKLGKFTVADGEYRHRLKPFKYAYKYNKDTKTSEDLMTSGGGRHDSPAVKVKFRDFKGTGADHFHFTPENVKLLAKIIESEMGEGNDSEKSAIAWAVRNQMIRLGVKTVADARAHFKDASGSAATVASRKMAAEVLKKPMSDDPVAGGFKWFSPKRMPSTPDGCKKKIDGETPDCEGGLKTFKDLAGKDQQRFTPGWSAVMTRVSVGREWLLNLYKL